MNKTISSTSHHHADEFVIVDVSISVDVGLPDHLVHFLLRQLLPQVRHHVPQLRRRNQPVSVPVENLESLDQLLFSIGVLHFPA